MRQTIRAALVFVLGLSTVGIGQDDTKSDDVARLKERIELLEAKLKAVEIERDALRSRLEELEKSDKKTGEPTVPVTSDPKDPLASWVLGGRWIGLDAKGVQKVWTVRKREGSSIEIETPSNQGAGTLVVELHVKKQSQVVVSRVSFQNTPRRVNTKDWKGEGKIGPKSLVLSLSYVWYQGGRKGQITELLRLKPE